MNDSFSKYSSYYHGNENIEVEDRIVMGVKEQIYRYKKITGKTPEIIIIYRNTLHSKMRKKLLTKELPALKTLMNSEVVPIKMVYIIVNKRSRAKFYEPPSKPIFIHVLTFKRRDRN